MYNRERFPSYESGQPLRGERDFLSYLRGEGKIHFPEDAKKVHFPKEYCTKACCTNPLPIHRMHYKTVLFQMDLLVSKRTEKNLIVISNVQPS